MLSGKIALVTGGGGEIGRAASLLFAREGATVIVSDISSVAAAETAQIIHAAGGTAAAVPADIRQRASVNELVEGIITRFGRLDCAFNNAGINLTRDAEWNLDAYLDSMEINANGTMYCMTAEAEVMLRQGGGTIVNNASVMGVVGSSRQPGYSASKHAVIGLTRTGALRWAKEGVRVNAVCPGPVQTAMTEAAMSHAPEIRARILGMSPMGRLALPDEIAQAALWLCSDRSSFVTGIALPIDGGFTAG